MAGGCSDDDLVRPAVEAAVDEVDVPSGHFPNLVAAFAGAASIGECGESAVGVRLMWSMCGWVLRRRDHGRFGRAAGSLG